MGISFSSVPYSAGGALTPQDNFIRRMIEWAGPEAASTILRSGMANKASGNSVPGAPTSPAQRREARDMFGALSAVDPLDTLRREREEGMLSKVAPAGTAGRSVAFTPATGGELSLKDRVRDVTLQKRNDNHSARMQELERKQLMDMLANSEFTRNQAAARGELERDRLAAETQTLQAERARKAEILKLIMGMFGG